MRALRPHQKPAVGPQGHPDFSSKWCAGGAERRVIGKNEAGLVFELQQQPGLGLVGETGFERVKLQFHKVRDGAPLFPAKLRTAGGFSGMIESALVLADPRKSTPGRGDIVETYPDGFAP